MTPQVTSRQRGSWGSTPSLLGISESEMTLVPTKYPFLEHAIEDIYQVPSVLHFLWIEAKGWRYDPSTLPFLFLTHSYYYFYFKIYFTFT